MEPNKGGKIYRIPFNEIPDDVDITRMRPLEVDEVSGEVKSWVMPPAPTIPPWAEAAAEAARKGEPIPGWRYMPGGITATEEWEQERAREAEAVADEPDSGSDAIAFNGGIADGSNVIAVKGWPRVLQQFYDTPWWVLLLFTSFCSVLLILMTIFWLIPTYFAPPAPQRVQLNLRFKSEVVYRVPVAISSPAFKPIEGSVTLETSGDATGTAQLPDGTAQGKIRFLSFEIAPVNLAASTVVATGPNGVTYRLINSVTVPGLNVNNGQAGLIDVAVRADRSGPEGNLPGGIGNFILRNNLRVVGLGPITGGTTKTIKVATSADFERLKTALQNQLQQQEEANRTALDQQVAPGWLRLNQFEVIGQTYTTNPVQISQEATGGQIKVKLVAQLKGLSYDPAELMKPSQEATASTSTSVVSTPALITSPVATTVSTSISDLAQLPLQGRPTFVRVEEATGAINNSASGFVTLVYSRPVQGAALVLKLAGWTGSQSEFERLLEQLKSRTELEVVAAEKLSSTTNTPTNDAKVQLELNLFDNSITIGQNNK